MQIWINDCKSKHHPEHEVDPRLRVMTNRLQAECSKRIPTLKKLSFSLYPCHNRGSGRLLIDARFLTYTDTLVIPHWRTFDTGMVGHKGILNWTGDDYRDMEELALISLCGPKGA